MAASPNLEELDTIWSTYRNDYSGKWITTAWFFYGARLYAEASEAFEKARDGFGKRSAQWRHLDAWREHAAMMSAKK